MSEAGAVVTNPLFSSKRHDHETPDELFSMLYSRFHFAVDLAATNENKKIGEYIGPDHENEDLRDSLALPWHAVEGWLWLNPPYGSALPTWMKKCFIESRQGARICALVPSRTDTNWWHNYASKADIRVEIKGRLKFKGEENSAPFPSALLLWCGIQRETHYSQDVIMWDPKDNKHLDEIVKSAKTLSKLPF